MLIEYGGGGWWWDLRGTLGTNATSLGAGTPVCRTRMCAHCKRMYRRQSNLVFDFSGLSTSKMTSRVLKVERLNAQGQQVNDAED